MSSCHLRGSALALAAGLFVSPASLDAGAAEENAVTLEELSVTGQASAPPVPPPAAVQTPVSTSVVPSDPAASPIVRRFQLPQTSASVTREQIDETVNVVDTEDAIKYFPSLFVRKRNEGDTQPVIETRTWGVNSSARTLVYADDVLISALIANNNTIGAPRWGIVAPEEIKRVDFLYGPFAAAFPGNSIGGVLQITTRMPDYFEATLKQTGALQTSHYYRTDRSYETNKTSATFGDRIEDFSWFLSADYLNTFTQPLTFVTNGSAPNGTVGTIPALNKTGQVANVVGAGGLLHSEQANAKLKMALDITPWLTATYTFGFWSNTTNSAVQSYLVTPTGVPTFGNVSTFAQNRYTLDEQHMANALSLKTDTSEARRVLKNGQNPIEQRRLARAEPEAAVTFGAVADQVVADLSHGFRNDKHKAQWTSTLATHAVSLRAMPVDAIGTADVLAVLTPIWRTKAETASRVRGRIERILDAAKAKGLRTGENPARWRGHLDKLLPPRHKLTRGHHAAMPFADVPAFIADLRQREAVAAMALEFCILNTSRSGEVLGARWDEIDRKARVWTIPPERMKASLEHRVPLTERALAILGRAETIRSSEYVFPGQKRGRPLSVMAMEMQLRRMKVPVTVHGFRSSFRDWAGERTSFPRDVAEMALAHVVGDATERAYRRGDALEKRRKLMEAWSAFVGKGKPSDTLTNVAELQRTA